MRARPELRFIRSVITAAVLTVTAVPVLAQNAVLFPVKFNEIAKGEVPAIVDGDDVFVAVSDLERLGVRGEMWNRMLNLARIAGRVRRVHGAEGVSLGALAPWLTFTLDEANLSLVINTTPELLTTNRLAVTDTRPRDIIYSRDNSTFLNYSVSSGGGQTSFSGESGTSIKGNLLFTSFTRPPGGPLLRLLTNFSTDDRARLQRRTYGDAYTISDVLGSSVLLGGVNVSRSYSIDPYFVRYPPFDFRGAAATPSRVDVYVNGIRVAQQEVPPGPFDLRNLPITAGAGNAEFVVTDAFGREQRFAESFYYSTSILAKGLSEYSYSAGVLRNRFGQVSSDYGDPAISAFHRYGLTNSLTVAGHVEATRQRWSAGPVFDLRTRFGDLEGGAALSSDHNRHGDAELLSYRYVARRMGFAADLRRYSRDFATLALSSANDRSLLDVNLSATLAVRRTTWTVQWSSSDVRDSPDRDRINLLASLPLTNRASLYVSGGSARIGTERHAEFFTGVSFYFGTTSANVTFARSADSSTTGFDVQRNLPLGTGYGYRLQSTSTGGDQSGSAVLQYQSDFGRYEAQVNPFSLRDTPRVSASGAAVYEKGAFRLTRAVQDSFALVRVPGIKDVRVYSSNILVGRTNANGDLLVPNLLAYYGNRLRIDDRDVPMDFDIAAVEKTIAPPYRGGAFVEFPVRKIQTVTGTAVLRRPDGEAVAAFGQMTLSGNNENFVSPLGRGGEFYFENVTQGRYDALIETSDTSCSMKLEIPASTTNVVKIGRVVCTTQEKHP